MVVASARRERDRSQDGEPINDARMRLTGFLGTHEAPESIMNWQGLHNGLSKANASAVAGISSNPCGHGLVRPIPDGSL
jgi:hypothetical protein